MAALRWSFGLIMVAIFLWIAIINWCAVALSITTRRFHSQIPLIGALFGFLGLLTLPFELPHLALYFLPLILDSGTFMVVLWATSVICRWIKTAVSSRNKMTIVM